MNSATAWRPREDGGSHSAVDNRPAIETSRWKGWAIVPHWRVPVRQIRDVLRLYHELHLSARGIARSLGVHPKTVKRLLDRAQSASLGWPPPDSVNRHVIEQLGWLPPSTGGKRASLPDP